MTVTQLQLPLSPETSPVRSMPPLPTQRFGIQFPVGDDVYISKDVFCDRAMLESPQPSPNSASRVWQALYNFDLRLAHFKRGTYEPAFFEARPYKSAAEMALRLFCKSNDAPPSPEMPCGRPLLSVMEAGRLLPVKWIEQIGGIAGRSVEILDGVVGQYSVGEPTK